MQRVSQSKSLSLITYQNNKGYVINPLAIQFLQTLPQNDQYSILSITGKSKTGKSFLLNQLLNHDVFPVSNNLDSNSKGLMISTKLLENNGMKVLVLDSQGFGSLQGNDDRDSKIFILSLLLSSVLIYNSMGTIDQQTLNNFSMIIQIGKMFEKQMKVQNSIPSLLWMLRDFSLKMQDKNGVEITSKEYLENALEEQKGNTQIICHKNRIRRIIKELFKQRNCQTLILPSQDINMGNHSSNINLRNQFIEDFNKFKNKLFHIIHKKGAKKIGGNPMTISSFITALKIYIKNLNQSISDGTIPKIQNITYQLRQSQAKSCEDKFKIFLSCKKSEIIEQLAELLKKNEKIENLDHIKNIFLQPIQKFYETTKSNITQLIGNNKLQQIQQIKNMFYQQLQKQLQKVILKWEQEHLEHEDIDNICQFLMHVGNQKELEQEYIVEIRNLKDRNIGKDKILFANMLMKVEIAYLRRKVQLSKQMNLETQKINLELEFTKKQLQRVQIRNKQLQNQLITQIKQSRKSFSTPNKPQNKDLQIKSMSKQPGLIRGYNDSHNKEHSNEKYAYTTSKVQSSSFYVPYVLIQKSEHLIAKIVRTLIKEDNKRNNYIEYVMDINLLGQKWIVNRKFKDFSELHSILVMMFQHSDLPDCKAITGPLSSTDINSSKKELVEQRRKQLQLYIHELIRIENIRNSRILQKFLKINKQFTVL